MSKYSNAFHFHFHKTRIVFFFPDSSFYKLTLYIGYKKGKVTEITLTTQKKPSSIILWQSVPKHNYLVDEHFASLGHDMPVQCQVKFSTPQIASLDTQKIISVNE